MITGRQDTEALAFARHKRSSGPFVSGLTPKDGRADLQFPGAAVGAALHVDVEHPREQPSPGDAAGSRLGGLDLAFGSGCGFGALFCLGGVPGRGVESLQ